MVARRALRVWGIEALEARIALATFYVAPTGNDGNAGSLDAPWQTLQYAVDQVAAGDTILARAGTYHEALTFPRSGSAGLPITLRAFPDEAVVLSGTALGAGEAVNLGNRDFITIENLAIRDYQSPGGDGFGIWGDGGNDGIVLRGLEISQVTEVIKLQGSLAGSVSHDVLISGLNGHDYSLAGIDVGPAGTIDGLTIRDVTLLGPGTGNNTAVDGIAVESGQHVTVENAVVTGHPGDGIDLKADHVIVRRATSTDQARNGIKIWGDDALVENSIAMNNGLSSLVLKSDPGALRHFTLSHNLIGNCLQRDYPVVLGDYDNPTAPLHITANGNLWVETAATGQDPILIYITSGAQLAGDYNIYYSANRSDEVIEWSGNSYSANDIQNGTWAAASGMDAHGLHADPLLGPDWRLLAGSPAIDRVPAGPAEDRDGNARPVGNGYDAGPYELGGTHPENLPPTLNTITDPAPISVGSGLQTIDLRGISAGVGETQTLRITASSSNPGLIPSPSVTYTSPDTTGSLSYTPVAGQHGSAIITVTVRDAGQNDALGDADDATFQRTFTVTVNAADAVVAIPIRPGGGGVVFRRSNGHFQVVNQRNGQLLLDEPFSQLRSLTIVGADHQADTLVVDWPPGADSLLPGGVVFQARDGRPIDTLLLRGTAAPDAVALTTNAAVINGLAVQSSGVEQLTLDGGKGNDTYVVAGLGARTTIADTKGSDALDVSESAVGVTVNLASRSAQRIFRPTNVNTLTLKGTIERAIGTESADWIKGNAAANRIEGRGGNDVLFGSSGRDILDGGDGDDWLYGDAGNDLLYGGPGNNVLLGGDGNDVLDAAAGVLAESPGRSLLIGGKGRDRLQGGDGEEILIGGTTKYDKNAAALDAVMGEWTSDQPFADRCLHLEEGVPFGAKGNVLLRRNKTVFDDKAADAILGRAGHDWFFRFGRDNVMDRSLPEDR